MAITVVWEGVNGMPFALEGELDKLRGPILSKPTGLTGSINRTLVQNPNGVGSIISGYSIPIMEGSLAARVYADPETGLTVGETYESFVTSFSPIKPGRLTVTDSRGYPWHCDLLLSETIPTPEQSPLTVPLPWMDVTISVVCMQGLWVGETKTYGPGASVQVENPGDFPCYPKIVWKGRDKTVTPPGATPISLPTTNATRVLDSDPGTGYVITDRAGSVDVGVWRTMRGLAVYGRVDAGDKAVWGASEGVTLEVTPLCMNPWR